MARRKRFAEEWERPPGAEKPPEPTLDRAPTTEQEDEERQDLPESIFQLQAAIGNRALSSALINRFALPGAPELELPKPEDAALPSMQPEELLTGIKDLEGQSPAEQVASFMEKIETLPQETQELLHSAARIAESHGQKGMDVQALKSAAHARLGKIGGSKITDPRGLVDRLCDAVVNAWKQWQLEAKFKNVMIMGPTAIGGELEGPSLGSLVSAMSGMASGEESEAVQAVAGPLEDAMKRWQDSVKFPGLPLYPAFAAWPGPQTPEMPNIPCPLRALVSDPSAFQSLSASGRTSDPGAAAVAQAVLEALGFVAFPAWVDTTLIVGLMGKGPVPTFAPPYVPVGPVIAGDNLPLPGVLV